MSVCGPVLSTNMASLPFGHIPALLWQVGYKQAWKQHGLVTGAYMWTTWSCVTEIAGSYTQRSDNSNTDLYIHQTAPTQALHQAAFDKFRVCMMQIFIKSKALYTTWLLCDTSNTVMIICSNCSYLVSFLLILIWMILLCQSMVCLNKVHTISF